MSKRIEIEPLLPFEAALEAGVERVRSPLCFYGPACIRRGEAELGPAEVLEGCVNRSIRCLTCGASGVESISTDTARPGRFLKIDAMMPSAGLEDV